MAQAIRVDFDAAELPVNSSGFGGLCQKLVVDCRDARVLCAQPGWCYIARSELSTDAGV